jgi:ABC-type transport system substrate-binding protein
VTFQAAGALAVVLGLLVTGCTRERDSAEPPPSTTRPAPTGGLRVGVPEEAASLDPFDRRSRTPAAVALLGEILPQLFRVDPRGRARGWLADDASVRQDDAAASASFQIRTGAVWSDGTPITAEDLRFTLETVRSPAWPGSPAGYDRVVAVEGEGGSVRLRFDGRFPGWRRLFSGADFVLPAHRLRGQDLKAVWTAGPDLAGGPFRLGAVTPGLEVVLERNGTWWGDGPRVEKVRVLVVPDVRTMEQLLAEGELDVAWPPATVNRVGRFRALADVKVSVADPGGRLVALVANTETVPPARRRAVLTLPDRDRFVEALLRGEAKLGSTLAGVGGGDEDRWALHVPDPGAPGVERNEEDVLVAAQEEPMTPLIGRILESAYHEREATLELKFAEAPIVDGAWLPEGRFDFALVDDVAWPDPCWRCWFSAGSRDRGNIARVKGLDDLAAGAERGESQAVFDLERRLKDDAVLLPLWRPFAVLAGRHVAGLEANSWSPGPFWGAENWTPAD